MRAPARPRPSPRLGPVLDGFVARADVAAAIARDPLQLVVQAPRAEQEVVAYLTASLAFGQVAVIRRTVRALLQALGPSPTACLRREDTGALRARLAGLRYRWLDDAVLARFLGAVGALLRAHGTLESAFAAGLRADAADVGDVIDAFSAELLGHMGAPVGRVERFLAPSPRTGSACKRTCLFLRWVARPADGVDLGLWTRVPPRLLVLPLDTHVARLSRYLGLTARASAGWAMALDATQALRRLCPDDPLRYDFPLCHLGISGRCPRRRVEAICADCDLREICRLPKGRTRGG